MESLANATETGGDLVLMVKPQFEVGKHRIGRGEWCEESARREAVEKSPGICGKPRIARDGYGTQPAPRTGRQRRVLPMVQKKIKGLRIYSGITFLIV